MNYDTLTAEELRDGIRQRDQQLRDEIAKNDGYLRTLGANVKEISELKEQLAQAQAGYASSVKVIRFDFLNKFAEFTWCVYSSTNRDGPYEPLTYNAAEAGV